MVRSKKTGVLIAMGVVSIFSLAQAASYTIAVNAGTKTGSWNRFYERGVASDHMHTVLSTAYGRGIKHAMTLAHDSCGFGYIRGHGVLDDDDAVYTEDASGNAVYNWNGIDGVYDSITAAGMRPLVEISFMPNALASANTHVNSVWYNNVIPNWNAPKDWDKWKAFMSAFLTHLESRYGAAEVRSNWLFELWNEPNWMYGGGGGDNGYLRLYDSTAVAFAATDPQVRLGGPAEGGNTSLTFDPQLITHCKSSNKEISFVTYHYYANNGAGTNIATVSSSFHKQMVDAVKATNSNVLILCDEMGPTFTQGTTCIDNEQSASFVAKAIHLLNSNDTTAYPPPYVFSWWVVSDLYEETNNTGEGDAFTGCYGLMCRGSSTIPQSWDVRKPVFNAYMLLHRLGAYKVSCTGGTTASPGVNAVATISTKGDTISVLVYSHVDGTTGNSSTTDNVTLNITMPTGWTSARMEHFVVDVNHSNSYQSWVGLGKPANPTAAQWTTIANAAQLAHYDSVANVTITGGTYTKTFTQNYYSVGLIQLTRPSTQVLPTGRMSEMMKLNATLKGHSIYFNMPTNGVYSVQLFSANGRKVMDRQITSKGSAVVSLANVTGGIYLLECSGPSQKLAKTIVVGK